MLRQKPFCKLGDLLILAIPLLALFPLKNNDLWWHLAAGRWIVENGTVPGVDPFSYTKFLGNWIDNQWLSQLLLYGCWYIAGNPGLIVLRAILFTLLVLLLRSLTQEARFPSMFLPTAVVTIAISYGWWELRPSVFTLMGTLSLLVLLQRIRLRRSGYQALPLLFLVWANLHPGFLLGLFILIGTLFALLLEIWIYGKSRWTADRSTVKRLFFWTLLSVAATLINPYHWHVYEQPFTIAANSAYRIILDEWAPPPIAFQLFVLLTVLAFLGLRFRKISLVDLVPVLFASSLSLTAARFEEFFAWIALPSAMVRLGPLNSAAKKILLAWILLGGIYIGVSWPPGLDPTAQAIYDPSSDLRLLQRSRYTTLIVSLTLALSLLTFLKRKSILSCWRSRCPVRLIVPASFLISVVCVFLSLELGWLPADAVQQSRYPTACLSVLPRDPDSHILNRLSWGGWIIWHKRIQTYIDGRCWGEPIFFEYYSCGSGRWREVFRKWNIQWVIVAPTDAIANRMSESNEWEIVCRDPASIVFRLK